MMVSWLTLCILGYWQHSKWLPCNHDHINKDKKKILLISNDTIVDIGGPGGYSTLVWVGVCRWDFWNATHPCTHFEGKVTHPCTKNQNFSLIFAPFWRKFRKILKSWPIKVPNLRHFGANFRKFWKIDPSKYHVFEKKGTHWCTWRPDFATHVCGTSL